MSELVASQIIATLKEVNPQLVRNSGEATERLANGHLILEETPARILLVGLPRLSLETQRDWLGGIYLSDWPRAAYEIQRLAILSSRLTRKLGQHSNWFDALRTIACQLEPEKQVLITAEGTTSDRFLKRLNVMFGVSVFSIVFDEPASTFTLGSEPNEIRFSQPLELPACAPGIEGPKPDRFLIALAHQIRALNVKSNSQTCDLLMRRLNDSSFEPGTIHINADSEAADELAQATAVLRVFLREPMQTETLPTGSNATVLETPPFDDYLLHWTRSPDGPWPDEDPNDYLDALILGVESKDRTAFATLLRIIETETLVATSHLIRGGHKVVCFSDTRVEALPERRVYRRHLHRWDCEPYGIAIRRSALPTVRSVQYGTEGDFAKMPPEVRPYFQLDSESSEWRDEAEWRTVGDVDLTSLEPNDAFIFAPSVEEVRHLAEVSKWPCIMIGQP